MFSIVLATYNGSRFIEKQIETLIEQTTKPAEIIVSDDLSTDNTVEVVETLRARAPFPITVRRNPSQLGYGDNFLSACELATQPYVCFCDQDDIWLPEKLSRYADWIRSMPGVSLFIHQGEVVDEQLQPTGSHHPKIADDRLQPPVTGKLLDRPPGFAMCFSRSLITGHDWRKRPADFQFGGSRSKHDSWIIALANAEGGIYYSSEILAQYRRHGANASFYHPGTNRQRRLGQLKALTRGPKPAMLEIEIKAYQEHAAYFEGLVRKPGLPPEAADRYTILAKQYRRALELDEYRLNYYRSPRISRAGMLVNGALAGMYHDGARFNRRSFVQDIATLWRPADRVVR